MSDNLKKGGELASPTQSEELQGEVGFRDGKGIPFGKAEDIVAEIRKGEVE